MRREGSGEPELDGIGVGRRSRIGGRRRLDLRRAAGGGETLGRDSERQRRRWGESGRWWWCWAARLANGGRRYNSGGENEIDFRVPLFGLVWLNGIRRCG